MVSTTTRTEQPNVDVCVCSVLCSFVSHHNKGELNAFSFYLLFYFSFSCVILSFFFIPLYVVVVGGGAVGLCFTPINAKIPKQKT